VLVVIVIAGGYIALGSSYASARVSNADGALSSVQHIDFTTTLSELSGGFDINSSSFDSKAYQARVSQFTNSITADITQIQDDAGRLDAAKKRLGDAAWLTALSRSSLDAAAGRIDHAKTAIDTATSLTADMSRDGQFFQAYATSLVDFDDYVTQANAGNATIAIAKVEQAKTDLGKALGLAGAPGLPSGVHELVSDLQALISDISKAINAGLTGDTKTHDAALAQAQTDATALTNLDTSSFDSAIQGFYEPRISTYESELHQASS
jgi:hypothetical protein